jgi:hypothetical protein
MSKHFENLWEESECCYKETIDSTTHDSIIDELKYKIDLYKSIANSDIKNIKDEEKQKIKSHVFGEILMTLTQLSLKDSINSYKALQLAIYYKNIDTLSKKY